METMKRLILHCAVLSCFLALAALIPLAADAADAAPTPLDKLEITSDPSKPDETNYVIKPSTGKIGTISVSSGVLGIMRGVISGEGMGLAKTGAGQLRLQGVNTYSGGTYIAGGKIQIESDDNLGAKDGQVVLDGGTLRAISKDIETDRDFFIGENNGGIEAANTSSIAIHGQISGGKLIKGGDGIVTLSNAKNDFQQLQIGAGTLRLINPNAAGKEAVYMAGGKLELAMDTNTIMPNAIEGKGTVTKVNDNTLTMSGTHLQASVLEVSAGRLNVTNTLESPAVTVAKNTTLAVGTLRFANGMDFKLTNEGTFTYKDLQIVGKGNTLSSAIPSAAGKRLSFVLSPTVAKGDTMLKVTGNALNVAGSTIALSTTNNLTNLNKGDSITLVDKTTGTIAGINENHTVQYGATTYTFTSAQGTQTVDANGNVSTPANTPLTLTYQGSQMTGGSSGPAKAYLESAIAGLHTVATGGRFMGTTGIREAVNSSVGAPGGRTGWSVSAAFRGSYEKVDTGSDIEGGNYTVMSALTYRMDNRFGITRVGLFAEGGYGDFDTSNRIAGRGFSGDSDIKYAGGGILARHDLPFGLYGEGTFRMGRVDNDFTSDNRGLKAEYDTNVPYWGGHLGLGYIYAFTEMNSIDVFGKFFWTRQDGDSVKTKAGERLKIDSADSLVSQLGARYSHAFPNSLSLYAGAAWEHEYDGEQTGKLNGRKISAPDMGGSNGVGEIGLRFMPEGTGFSVDVSAHGSLGVREGVGGTLSLGYEF